MRGYIVFVFSVNMLQTFVFVKEFSGTTIPRILKFGTNIGYDLLYCVIETQPPSTYHSLYLSIFLSLQQKFLTHLESGQVFVRKETKMLRFILLSFSIFRVPLHMQRQAYAIPLCHSTSLEYALALPFPSATVIRLRLT